MFVYVTFKHLSNKTFFEINNYLPKMTLRLCILIVILFCHENVAYREIKAGIFDLVKFPVSFTNMFDFSKIYVFYKDFFYSFDYHSYQRIYILE